MLIKGTLRLPTPDEAVRLHEAQLPLVIADTFTGEPGFSAPCYEVDFAPRKSHCDVLLQGSAHGPVGLRVGKMAKSFAVVSDRRWHAGVASIEATPPEPFVFRSVSYDVAFGPVDQEHDDPMKHDAFMSNPVGRGFRRHLRRDWVDGRPLPNTEELNRAVTRPDDAFRPMALSPLGRGWEPRYHYAGTYDDKWLEQHYPFLPPDFDERYYQAVPAVGPD